MKVTGRIAFGHHIGIGHATRAGVDVGLLFRHFSNRGIKQPDSGVDFGVVRVSRSS